MLPREEQIRLMETARERMDARVARRRARMVEDLKSGRVFDGPKFTLKLDRQAEARSEPE